MGADAFHVCYGLRWEVDTNDEPVTSTLERRTDPRQIAARRQGLDSWWGSTTDERIVFLLIGKLLGHYGWEGTHSAQLDSTGVVSLMEETRLKLLAAGFTDEPAWLFQFEPNR